MQAAQTIILAAFEEEEGTVDKHVGEPRHLTSNTDHNDVARKVGLSSSC
jgi:hypothetical protein